MPRRISIAPHHSTEQLKQAYKLAKDGLKSRQYQIIWLLAAGKTTEEVQQITGYSRIWIYELVKRYNQLGLEGLGDSPRGDASRTPPEKHRRPAADWRCRTSTVMASFTRKSSRRRTMEWSQGSRLVELYNGTSD